MTARLANLGHGVSLEAAVQSNINFFIRVRGTDSTRTIKRVAQLSRRKCHLIV